MAAGDWTWYGVGPNVDLSSGTYKIMLTTSGHTPNQDTHDFRDDLTSEVAATGGYTAGGVTVTVSRTYDGTSNEIRVAVQDAVWGPGATITFRNAHLYKAVGSAATDPLIAYIAYAGDQSVVNGTLTIDNAAVTLKGTVAT